MATASDPCGYAVAQAWSSATHCASSSRSRVRTLTPRYRTVCWHALLLRPSHGAARCAGGLRAAHGGRRALGARLVAGGALNCHGTLCARPAPHSRPSPPLSFAVPPPLSPLASPTGCGGHASLCSSTRLARRVVPLPRLRHCGDLAVTSQEISRNFDTQSLAPTGGVPSLKGMHPLPDAQIAPVTRVRAGSQACTTWTTRCNSTATTTTATRRSP